VVTHAIRLLLVLAVQAKPYSYAGIGLGSDIGTVARRYPHSTAQASSLRLAPEDIRDHVSAIEISGTGPGRRVRIAFETDGPQGAPEYPRCRAIEAALVAQFGAPTEIRRFSEEASARADRLWRSPSEELALLCFTDAQGRLWAEAVQITPRDPSAARTAARASKPGAPRITELAGSRETPGLFTQRLVLPAGFCGPVHTHDRELHGLVLRGLLLMAVADSTGRLATHEYSSGSFVVVPAGRRHLEGSRVETEIHLSGIGPLRTVVLDSASAARCAATPAGR
jgi:quercetin dioxygenase-like cupin family protein